MGAVLLMLLALILPVAPAAAAGENADGGTLVHAAAVPNQTISNDCAANVQNDGKTNYFITLTSSTGTRIPAVNGGPPATVTLIGTGTANLNQTVPMPVGDLENRAFPGVDNGNGTLGGTPNGVCTDPQVAAPGPNDVPPGTLDALFNDYGTTQPVFTGTTGATAADIASRAANTWRILITAPGHRSAFGDLNTLVDSSALGVTGPGGGTGAGTAPGATGQLPNVTYPFGTGCTDTQRGCVVSMGTVQLQALTVPQAGRGSISGTVTDITGVPLIGVEIVLYRQPDQDPTNDATLPIPENQAFSVLTDGTGQYLVNGLWPGRYSVTVADTRILPCVLNANCGIQPATKIVNLFPTGVFANVGDPLQQTVNFAVPTDVAAAQSPGQSLAGTPTLTGLFGYVIDGSSGGRIGALTPGTNSFNPNGGNAGGLGVPVQIVFTPTLPTACTQGLNPPQASSTCVGSVTTATTDQNGRYQVVLVAGVAYAVSINGFANSNFNLLYVPGSIANTAGSSLPLGFQGACSAGGNDPASPGTLFQCGVGAQGQDRFTIPATQPVPLVTPFVNALTAGAWNGGGTFVLVPSNATQIPAIGQTSVRRLEAVIPGIYRNPDTSYTGVDIETIQVRVMNNGVQRTGAQIEWFSTSSDDVASLVKTDTLDLNAGAVGIFTRAIIPDGCTRCMAQIFSIDLDAPTPFLGPGFLPNTTPYVPGTNGYVYGLSDLQATVTHRVVDAGNALAGSNGITFEDLFPTGANISQGWTIPLVYKNYGGGVNKWNSVLSACLTRGVGGPQPIVFQFLSNGETRGGPYQITRSTNPGGCVVLNLNTLDPNDPDYFDPLAGLPDGTYSVVVDSTSGLQIPGPAENTGGMFGMALSYSTTGRMAVLSNGNVAISNENVLNGIREVYAPLIFKRYNDWNSGISVAGFRPRPGFQPDFGVGGGGSGSGASIAIYGEDGTLVGVFVDGISRSSGARQYYLPALPIQLPDGFRGSAIISSGDNTAGSRMGAQVMSVNYERNQATNYNTISQDTSVRPATPNSRPCSYAPNSSTDPQASSAPPNTLNPVSGLIQFPTNWVSCLTVPDAQRRFSGAPRGSGATFEVGLGPTTGVRLFNPDPYKSGTPAYILASYLDSSGVVWDDAARTTFSIPAYHTATIFLGANTSLPDIYDGSMFIMSNSPIVGIGNVVDYRVTDRDASYSFNLPNQSGRTM